MTSLGNQYFYRRASRALLPSILFALRSGIIRLSTADRHALSCVRVPAIILSYSTRGNANNDDCLWLTLLIASWVAVHHRCVRHTLHTAPLFLQQPIQMANLRAYHACHASKTFSRSRLGSFLATCCSPVVSSAAANSVKRKHGRVVELHTKKTPVCRDGTCGLLNRSVPRMHKLCSAFRTPGCVS